MARRCVMVGPTGSWEGMRAKSSCGRSRLFFLQFGPASTTIFRVKALVKASAEPGLWLRDVPEPTIGINDVLIRVLRTGICGTDLHIFDWNEWAQQTIPVPMVIGH